MGGEWLNFGIFTILAMTTKKPFSFRLDVKLMNKLKEIAAKENRKLTNLIETILINYTNKKK